MDEDVNSLNEKLADLIFPDINEQIADLEIKYPKRNLKDGAVVTRLAPSPTGFLHIGGLFQAIIHRKLASQTDGVFMLRIEDTDKKREVENGVKNIVDQLEAYGIIPDEGVMAENMEKGEYGPYKQSNREYIYKVCAKELIKKGKAYPCFCTAEELDNLRAMQEASKQVPGYYGTYARCRNYTVQEAMDKIRQGMPYVIRFRSSGNHLRKTKVQDVIRGKIEMAQNDQDIVIIKSDGLPTYHFAHAVDDHFMRTTLAMRGEEWIASAALHTELFEALGFEQVLYAHTPTIMKLDNGAKRKISKRKDPESAVSYFIEEGYPAESVIEYLLTIINSDYEIWRKQHPDLSWDKFNVRLEKLNSSGALFDMVKLNDVSKGVIANFTSEELLKRVLDWSKIYNQDLYNLLNSNLDYALKIFAIERDGAIKKRKDIAKYNEILSSISYMYPSLFNEYISNGLDFNFKDGKITKDVILNVINEYMTLHMSFANMDKESWFASVKEIAEKLGFCINMKEYKQNPDSYIGSIADVTDIIRVCVTNRHNTPDIYEIMQVLGNETVISRLGEAVKFLEKE